MFQSSSSSRSSGSCALTWPLSSETRSRKSHHPCRWSSNVRLSLLHHPHRPGQNPGCPRGCGNFAGKNEPALAPDHGSMSSSITAPPLNLRRRFALSSLGVIAVIALSLGWLMSHVLTQRMLQREGEVSMDFIQNLLITDQSAQYLAHPKDAALRARLAEPRALRLHLRPGSP